MVSFKDGILKIEKNERDRFFRFPFEICLYLGLVFYNLVNSPLHYVGVAILIAGAIIITAGKLFNSRINFPILSIWYLAFLCFAEMSSLWAYSPLTSAFKYIKFMLLILTFCFGITQYADTKKDVERLMDIFLYVSLTIVLIEYIGTPFEKWFEGYFGSFICGSNTNTFSYITMFAALMAFYKSYIKGKKLWYLATVLFLFSCLLSSSRKAVAMSSFGILFFILFAVGRKHHILHFIIAILTVAFIFSLIMTNDVLYNVIGYRINTLIVFTNDSEAINKTDSLQLRDYYINFAQVLFHRKPIFGQGFANFATLLNAETNQGYFYSHNNYWEILADLGIVGFILYYWFYIYMAIRLIIRLVRKEFTELKLLAATMLVMEFILEWGVISMFFPYHQTVITLMYVFINVYDKEDKKKFFYSGQENRTDSNGNNNLLS